MSNEGFYPLSNQLGIPGSSYRLQLGKVNEKWAVRLAKGPEILASKIFDETDDPPNANTIVGWVLQVLVIPNINPYQIAKSVGFIRQEASRRAEALKKKPAVSIKDAKSAKLEELPQEAKEKLKSQKKTVGWVKQESKKPSPPAPSPKPAAPVSPQKTEPVSKATESKVEAAKDKTPKKRRSLPQIPGAQKSGDAITVSSSKPVSKKAESSTSEKGTYIVKVPKGTKKIIIEFE